MAQFYFLELYRHLLAGYGERCVSLTLHVVNAIYYSGTNPQSPQKNVRAFVVEVQASRTKNNLI